MSKISAIAFGVLLFPGRNAHASCLHVAAGPAAREIKKRFGNIQA